MISFEFCSCGCAMLEGEARHGTHEAHRALGCRCGPCMTANRLAARSRRLQGLPDDDPRHGTRSGRDNYGCECYACTTAAREYHRARYLKRVARSS